MRARLAALGLAITIPSPALAGSIGFYSAPDCSSCNVELPAGQVRQVYITYSTEGLSDPVDAITGAQFRVTGLPGGWTAEAQLSHPHSFVHGDPFGPQGVSILFSSPIPTGLRCIRLYTVTLRSEEALANVDLKIRSASRDDRPILTVSGNFPITIPIAPFYRVDGGSLHVNSNVNCEVAVERSQWAKVKELFR